MNAFAQVPRDVRRDQTYRDALLAQPPEYFRVYFGSVPDQMQKVYFVEELIQLLASPKTFANDVYYVQLWSNPPFLHLNISRRDGEPCTSWRDFQQIKNELIGPEYEGVELFPAESRLVDTAHQYHMWVMADAKYRFPFGYENRLVLEKPLIYGGKDTEMTIHQDCQPMAVPVATATAGRC